MAVHGDNFAYVRRRSGLGGTGGRNLSPELRVKFGTYGFNKKGKVRHMTASNEYTFGHGRNYVSGAYTNLMDFDGSQADYRANMAIRQSDRITVRDSLETADESLNKPPEMRTSVDMGMASEETVASVDGSVRSHA